jgi:ADP-heptose:LPS heptosyltransferase
MINRRSLRAALDPLAARLGALKAKGAPPSGLLLVQAGGLGDTLLFSLFIHLFRPLLKPGEKMTLLIGRHAQKMSFAFAPDIEILPIDFAQLQKSVAARLSILSHLRQRNFRHVVSVDHRRHAYLDDSLIYGCQAPETSGFAHKSWPKYEARLTRNERRFTTRIELSGHVPMLRRWMTLAQALTGQTAPPPRLRLPEPLLPPPALQDRPLILFQPFASSRDRQVTPAFWEALLQAVPESHEVRLLAGPGDLERNPDFKPLAEKLKVEVLGFKELIPLVQAARLLVSIDSAVMHLAVLAGANVLCLAAGAYVGEVTPHPPEFDPGNVTVYREPIDCEGCVGDCVRPLVLDQYECVHRLKTGTAIGLMRDKLKDQANFTSTIS